MNIIEKAVEKLESEVEDLLREQQELPVESVESGDGRVPQANRDGAAAPEVVAESAGAAEKNPGTLQPGAIGSRRQAREGASAAEADLYAGTQSTPPTQSESVDLDLEGLSAAGFVTPARDQSLLAEEFRIVKRPLLERISPSHPAHVANGNLIIITSSLPGEGKTFNSVNLALSMAMEVDRNVLLVDADVAKSDVSRVFGIGERRGLSNYLDGSEKDLSELIIRTNVDSLSVLPSGPRHPRITELVASAQMRTLVSELSSRYSDRVVIFDSPPLLATTGASVLAGLMGQVLLVVEAVRTPKSAVRESLRRLGSLSNVNIILNKQRRMGGGRYGYEYGYGYGYGYGHSREREAREPV